MYVVVWLYRGDSTCMWWCGCTGGIPHVCRGVVIQGGFHMYVVVWLFGEDST